jgi:peptide/nickel transport system substrate-binding protein
LFAELSRRQMLQGAAGLPIGAALTLGLTSASAHARAHYGGRLSMRIPWSLSSVDPHRLDDATAAILGPSLFDTLYQSDEQDAWVPALAEGDPVVEDGKLRISLREGLRSSTGRALTSADVVSSIARMKKIGARAWLADLPAVWIEKGAISFRNPRTPFDAQTPALYKRLFASPLTAIVPANFDADRPDGTGAFRLVRRGEAWTMLRNRFAAMGPAYLDEIAIAPAASLAESLRAFEAGTDDLGWLGLGLHDPRRGAKPFDAGSCAYAILRTGADAGSWDAPGVAQQLANSLPYGRLSYLNLGAAWTSVKEEGWGGNPTSLFYREDSAWLTELAGAIAATLSRPGHELTAKGAPEADLRTLKASRGYALMLDTVRPLSAGPLGVWAALGSSDDAGSFAQALAKPPKFAADVSPRLLTRTFRVGIVGEVRIQGGRTPEVLLPAPRFAGGLDFGSIEKNAR